MNKRILIFFIINIFEVYSYNFSLFPFIHRLLTKNNEKIKQNKYNEQIMQNKYNEKIMQNKYILSRILLDKKVDNIVGKRDIIK